MGHLFDLIARLIASPARVGRRFFARVTPLTWCIWLAAFSDLAAPGYLVFHLGFTQVDISVVATELITAWEVTTGAPND